MVDAILLASESGLQTVTNGGLYVPVAPADPGSRTQTAFNAAQLQAVNLNPVQLTLTTTVSGSLSLNWANYGSLLSATNVAGPWTVVAGATSPLVVNPTNAAKFFRVLVQ